MESIETLIMLSKNPHYTMTPAQISVLRQYQMEQAQKNNTLNKNVVAKHDSSVVKTNTNVEE